VSDSTQDDGDAPRQDDAAAPVHTRLVLIRHGESQVALRRVIGGHRTCTGLSDFGRRQVEALRDRLARSGELRAGVLYASAYPRAIETAEIIAPALRPDGDPLDVKVEPGFGEHDPGPDCDGLTYDEFVQLHGLPDWESDPYATTFPGGETIADFHYRVGSTLRAIVAAHRGETIVVACHGGVIDAVMRIALRTPSTGGFELHTLNATITELVRVDAGALDAGRVGAGRWRLERYNDGAHLPTP
jgi:2,3-bisphosphoglycerate-dependent phosphoglycerate mutase